MIALTVAFAATTASANQDVNVKKVNKVIKSVVDAQQSEVITKVAIKFDEKSNLSNVESLKTGILLSATAKEAAWSKKPSTVDLNANIKTLTSDAAHTKLQFGATLGAKTEAVPLYAYIGQQIFKSIEDQPVENENDAAFREFFAQAAQTTSLEQIPAQLKTFIEIVKKALASEPDYNPEDALSVLLNSLTVDVQSQNNKTAGVALKTSQEVAVDLLGSKLLISELSMNMTSAGLNFQAKLAVTTETQDIDAVLDAVKDFLLTIQNAEAEVLEQLKEMAQGYISLVEEMVKGSEL